MHLIKHLMLIVLTHLHNQNQQPSSSEETEDTDESDLDDDANADTAEIVPEEGASLKLWFDNDSYNEKIVELWNKKYPDIPLVVENVGTIDSRAKIELDGPAGQGADVFVQAHDGVAISAQSGTILEVDKFTDKIRSEIWKMLSMLLLTRARFTVFRFL